MYLLYAFEYSRNLIRPTVSFRSNEFTSERSFFIYCDFYRLKRLWIRYRETSLCGMPLKLSQGLISFRSSRCLRRRLWNLCHIRLWILFLSHSRCTWVPCVWKSLNCWYLLLWLTVSATAALSTGLIFLLIMSNFIVVSSVLHFQSPPFWTFGESRQLLHLPDKYQESLGCSLWGRWLLSGWDRRLWRTCGFLWVWQYDVCWMLWRKLLVNLFACQSCVQAGHGPHVSLVLPLLRIWKMMDANTVTQIRTCWILPVLGCQLDIYARSVCLVFSLFWLHLTLCKQRTCIGVSLDHFEAILIIFHDHVDCWWVLLQLNLTCYLMIVQNLFLNNQLTLPLIRTRSRFSRRCITMGMLCLFIISRKLFGRSCLGQRIPVSLLWALSLRYTVCLYLIWMLVGLNIGVLLVWILVSCMTLSVFQWNERRVNVKVMRKTAAPILGTDPRTDSYLSKTQTEKEKVWDIWGTLVYTLVLVVDLGEFTPNHLGEFKSYFK